MTKEDRKNAYLYCKFRDEQFALYDEYAKRHGMLMKTFLVVNALFYDAVYSGGGMTQAELCQRTFQSKQTVNLIIKKLLSQGYVTVEEAPENKRNKVVQMTETGRERFAKVVRHITWAEDTAMSMFTPQEQALLVDYVRGAEAVNRSFPNLYKESGQAGTPGNGGKWLWSDIMPCFH